MFCPEHHYFFPVSKKSCGVIKDEEKQITICSITSITELFAWRKCGACFRLLIPLGGHFFLLFLLLFFWGGGVIYLFIYFFFIFLFIYLFFFLFIYFLFIYFLFIYFLFIYFLFIYFCYFYIYFFIFLFIYFLFIYLFIKNTAKTTNNADIQLFNSSAMLVTCLLYKTKDTLTRKRNHIFIKKADPILSCNTSTTNTKLEALCREGNCITFITGGRTNRSFCHILKRSFRKNIT